MSKLSALAVLATLCLLALPAVGQPTSSKLPVLCSQSSLLVYEGEEGIVDLAVRSASEFVSLRWSAAPTGVIEIDGAKAKWRFASPLPGRYTVTARSQGSVEEAACDFHVKVALRGGRGAGLVSGRSFLLSGSNEEPGFGMYSYILFGSPPTEDALPRYKSVLEAYFRVLPEVESFQQGLPLQRRNITYLPLVTEPDESTMSNAAELIEFVLRNYDYATAAVILASAGGGKGGPYLVSHQAAVKNAATIEGSFARQDMSWVPEKLSSLWLEDFLRRIEIGTTTGNRDLSHFAVEMRTSVAILADGVPKVQGGVETWITWLKIKS